MYKILDVFEKRLDETGHLGIIYTDTIDMCVIIDH